MAVVYVQEASSFRAFILIILGVAIALAFERLLRRGRGGRKRPVPATE